MNFESFSELLLHFIHYIWHMQIWLKSIARRVVINVRLIWYCHTKKKVLKKILHWQERNQEMSASALVWIDWKWTIDLYWILNFCLMKGNLVVISTTHHLVSKMILFDCLLLCYVLIYKSSSSSLVDIPTVTICHYFDFMNYFLCVCS